MRDWIIGTLAGAVVVGFLVLVAKTILPVVEVLWKTMK